MADASVTASNMSGAAGGIGSIFSLIGNMMNSGASSRAGQRQQQAANFEAEQLDQNAIQAQAAAQRDALLERRRTALLVSRGLAVAAAGGGATTDPTVTRLLDDIAGEGEYRSSTALYQGEEKARVLNMQAQARRDEGAGAAEMGQSRADAYRMAGIGSLATGAASLYTKYGMGGPKKALKNAGIDDWTDAGGVMGGLG